MNKQSSYSFLYICAAAFCCMWLAGCTATTTLYPPCPHREIRQFPQELYGRWNLKMSSDDDAWDILISAHPTEPKEARIEMQVEDSKKAMIFTAGAFQVGDTRFLQICPDVEGVLEKGGFSPDLAPFLKPLHFICEIRGSLEMPEWHVITFLRQMKGGKMLSVKLVPVDSSIVYGKDDHVIFNPSGELMDLLVRKKYDIAQKLQLVRKKQ